MKNFWLYFIFLALQLPGLTSLQAAEFTEGGDAGLKCIGTLSGQIVPGDTDRLRDFLAGLWERKNESINGVVLGDYTGAKSHGRLCLDSPGGSLAEAIRMADYLLKDFGDSYWVHGLGTAVPSGARCESACAVLFMAGGENTESDIGRIADRVLHAGGRLGFHSISLNLPEATYSKDDVSKAFGLALKSMGAVATRMEPLRLRLSLLQTMLATPPDDMYFVEKIGDAAHWNIQVAGLPMIEQPTSSNIYQACSRLYFQFTPEDGVTPTNYALEKAQEPSDSILQHDRWLGTNVSEDQFKSYKVNAADGRIEFVSDEGTELEDIGCSGYFDFSSGNLGAEVETSNGWFLDVPNFYMYPGDMTFAEILGLAQGSAAMPPATVIAQKETTPQEGTCLVFKGDSKTDDEPCQMSSLTTLNAGLESYTMESYLWPSGGKTVVERQSGKVLINGSAAEQLWRKTKPKPIADDYKISCLKNNSTGNAFCFRENE